MKAVDIKHCNTTQMLLLQTDLRVSMSQPWLYSLVAHYSGFLIVGLGLSRDVWSCPIQKGQLKTGTLGGELASGLSRDVCGCPVQKGQLGPQRQSHIRLGVKDDLGISLFPGIPQRQLWHFMAILDHPVV